MYKKCMKCNCFFIFFVFLFQIIFPSLFKEVPPEIETHILEYCPPSLLSNIRSSNKENRELIEGYLEKKYLKNQKLSHFFWEIFVLSGKKEKNVPIFIKQLCLKHFKDIAPAVAYFYRFSDIRNIKEYKEKNDSYFFSIIHDDKENYFSFVINDYKNTNYYYFELNDHDDLEKLLKFESESENSYVILKINYCSESIDFSWLALFAKKYKTLLIHLPECVYPPTIVSNKTKLLNLAKNTKIVVPKNDILIYGVNGIKPWLPQFLQNKAILCFLAENSEKYSNEITTNCILRYLYSSQNSCEVIQFLRFLFLKQVTFDTIFDDIKKLNNTQTPKKIMLFNLNQLFSIYHNPIHLLKEVLEYLKVANSYSSTFFNILEENIIKSQNEKLILDLYFFSGKYTLLKHIHNKTTLKRVLKECVVENYKNYRIDLFKSGIYIRLYCLLKEHKKHCGEFKKDVLDYFPENTDFSDQLYFHEIMLKKKSMSKKTVCKIFNNILLQKLSPEKCILYKKLFKEYYKKLDK